jgi:hypothetical protein
MGLFNLYKPRKYDYRYIYYDPEKEKKQEREKRMSGEEKGEYRPSIKRGTFREMASQNLSKTRSEQRRNANIRLIFIILALLACAYFILT